jgi:phosphomannomutase
MINKPQPKVLIESFSGVRGVYGFGIDEDIAYKYALSYCAMIKGKRLVFVIGGDSRASTSAIKKAMVKAFKDFGVKKIIDVGTVPVQVCQYAIIRHRALGGVYITASHNEPEYNGWKFLKGDGAILYKNQIDKLIRSVHQKEHKVPNNKSKIELLNVQKKAVSDYVDFISKKLAGKK